MFDIDKEVTEVFSDEFDIGACLALQKATIAVSHGKKRQIKAALSNFGYSEEYRLRIAREKTNSFHSPYHWKEKPWEDGACPSTLAITQLKASLMVLCANEEIREFLSFLNQDPRRIAFQWVQYWKVLIYTFPKQGYVNN